MSEVQWFTASLPIRLGGFGTQDPTRIHAAAAIASFLFALGGATGFKFSPRLTGLDQALNSLLTRPPPSHLRCRPSGTETTRRSWSPSLFASESRFDSDASSRVASLLHLHSGPHSGSWIQALPGGADTVSFSAAEWQALCRFRCGVPFGPGYHCGRGCTPLDPLGTTRLAAPLVVCTPATITFGQPSLTNSL